MAAAVQWLYQVAVAIKGALRDERWGVIDRA